MRERPPRRARRCPRTRLTRLVPALVLSSLSLLACGGDGPGAPTGPPPTDARGDLSIRFIERLPRIEYVPNSTNPEREGWPAPGQRVTWVAHVRNLGTRAEDVGYRWLLDGVEVQRGTTRVIANGEMPVSYEWPWTFDRHVVRLELDPDARVDEIAEGNNALAVHTDALAVGFWVERSFYDFFNQRQRDIVGAQSVTFEDWAHRHIARMNDMFERAVYPTSPNGVLDRVRLDRVQVAPDGALAGVARPAEDRTVDMMWGFPASTLAAYSSTPGGITVPADEGNPFYYSGSLLHELGHARYLVDVYAFRLYHGFAGDRVEVKEGARLAVETGLMPATVRNGSFNGGPVTTFYELFRTSDLGLMNAEYTYVDRYSAAALNLIAGHRAVAGNYNEPANIGIFTIDLPEENRLTVREAGGAALAGAQVTVYQGSFRTDPGVPAEVPSHYAKFIDATPDLQLTADADGRVLLGKNPFDRTLRRDPNLWASIAVVRVAHGGKVGYGYLERRAFNLARWSGQVQLADWELQVTLKDVPAGAKR